MSQTKTTRKRVNHKLKHKKAVKEAMKKMNEEKGFKPSPFHSRLCFIPLINYWKQQLNSENAGDVLLAKQILERLDSALEFLAPITDESILDQHEDLVDLLLMGFLSPSFREQAIMQIAAPFGMSGFYHTKRFSDMILQQGSQISLEREGEYFQSISILRACLCILNEFYGQNLDVIDPIVYSSTLQEKKGYEQYFKMKLNAEFVEIKKLKPLKPLSQTQINNLVSNFYDLDLWLQYIPPENFEFHGIEMREMIDITQEESISRLKRILLEKDAITSKENIQILERYLRSYFQMGDLQLGITAIDFPPEKATLQKYKIHHNLLASTVKNLLDPEHGKNIYYRTCKNKEYMIVEDMDKVVKPDLLQQELMKLGLKSIIIIPLLSKQNELIGLIELASPRPFAINSFTMLKLMDILPLFRTAIRRSRDEIDNQIEALIRENYTALHSSVEWKFIEESFRMLEVKGEGHDNPKP